MPDEVGRFSGDGLTSIGNYILTWLINQLCRIIVACLMYELHLRLERLDWNKLRDESLIAIISKQLTETLKHWKSAVENHSSFYVEDFRKVLVKKKNMKWDCLMVEGDDHLDAITKEYWDQATSYLYGEKEVARSILGSLMVFASATCGTQLELQDRLGVMHHIVSIIAATVLSSFHGYSSEEQRETLLHLFQRLGRPFKLLVSLSAILRQNSSGMWRRRSGLHWLIIANVICCNSTFTQCSPSSLLLRAQRGFVLMSATTKLPASHSG